eukprot:TRINITY_DN9348_c0_g1_i1.p1 TRINITY_DN9348_c0_g1~~TRINITY_DN9348_c0_g1_i1.p1  ORF type:complete len:182 (+),score=26.93 TRINITY_DN9348_c0_g1_i1:42-548(+)
MLAYGNCSYGDRCKFSHDVSSAKPKTVFDYIPQEISLNTEQDRTWYSQQPAAGYLKDFNEFPEWKFTCYSEDEDGKTFTDTSTDEVRWLAYKANNEKTLNQFLAQEFQLSQGVEDKKRDVVRRSVNELVDNWNIYTYDRDQARRGGGGRRRGGLRRERERVFERMADG